MDYILTENIEKNYGNVGNVGNVGNFHLFAAPK